MSTLMLTARQRSLPDLLFLVQRKGFGAGFVPGVGAEDSTSSTVMYNFGVGPRFAYVSASARAPK